MTWRVRGARLGRSVRLARFTNWSHGGMSFDLGKAGLHHFLPLVTHMRAQDMRQADAVATAQRVQDRFMLLHGKRPARWCHRSEIARTPDPRRHGLVKPR